MIGVEFVKDRNTKEPASDITSFIVRDAIQDGVIFGESLFRGLGNVIKIKPPLIISETQADIVLKVLEKNIKKNSARLAKNNLSE